MNTYLCIITTALVLTQIIRLIQNSINLHRQNLAIKRDLSWLKDRDVTQKDFDAQRECFYLLRNWLCDRIGRFVDPDDKCEEWELVGGEKERKNEKK